MASKRLILALYLLLWTAVSLCSCGNDISEIKAITDPQQLPVQTNHKAEFVYTESGKLRNKLIAETLERYEGADSYLLAKDGFTMIFYDSTETEEARLTAINGRYDQEKNHLVAWEKVELLNVKGEKLETEELVFAQDSGRIYTDKFVTITSASGVLFGDGLESNDSFTRYHILRPHGDLYVKEK